MVLCSEFVSGFLEGARAGREGSCEPVPEVGVDLSGPLHVWPVGGWDEHFFKQGNERLGFGDL